MSSVFIANFVIWFPFSKYGLHMYQYCLIKTTLPAIKYCLIKRIFHLNIPNSCGWSWCSLYPSPNYEKCTKNGYDYLGLIEEKVNEKLSPSCIYLKNVHLPNQTHFLYNASSRMTLLYWICNRITITLLVEAYIIFRNILQVYRPDLLKL